MPLGAPSAQAAETVREVRDEAVVLWRTLDKEDMATDLEKLPLH